MVGMIALDVDGTITADLLSVPKKVVDYLQQLISKGWKITFLTGRTLSFAAPILAHFNFPYLLVLQNGADILEMPQKKLLKRHYLTQTQLLEIERGCKGQKEDFVIYAGYEQGDFCYFRPEKCSKKLLEYFKKLEQLCDEPWKAVKAFDFDSKECFPLVKCFGDENEMKALNECLNHNASICATLIRDPVDRNLYLNLVTHHAATKGEALKWIKHHFAVRSIIAAGDDRNDIAMLEEADVRIVMETAPQEVLTHADIIAKSAASCGLIDALKKALQLIQ